VNERVNIHDIPFADRFKTGKLYESLEADKAERATKRQASIETLVAAEKVKNGTSFTGDREHELICGITASFDLADKAAGKVKSHRIEAGKLLIEAASSLLQASGVNGAASGSGAVSKTSAR
jgi:hypothetical protein